MKTYALLNGYYYELLLKSLPLLLTRCIFPNAVLFFLLIWQNLNLAAKGILISTAILTGMLVIMNRITSYNVCYTKLLRPIRCSLSGNDA